MKRIFCLFTAILMMSGFAGVSSAKADDMKWAYVDLQRAIRSVEKGKQAHEKLLNMKNERQKKLEKEEKALMDEKESLEKQKGVLSEDAMGRKKKEFTMKGIQLQTQVDNYERELMKAQQDLAGDILKDMEKIIQEIGDKEDYNIIFEKAASSLLYAQNSKDITDKVIDMYNKRFGK